MNFDRQVEYTVSGNFHKTLTLQMSAVLATALARKVRVSIPDQSSLVLQSLGQLSEKPNTDQGQSHEHQHLCTPETSEKSLKENYVLSRLSSPYMQSPVLLANIGGHLSDTCGTASSDNSLESITAHTHTVADNSASKYDANGVRSNSHPLVISNMPGAANNDSSDSSSILSYFIHHHQSHAELSDVAEFKIGDNDGRICRPSSLASDVEKSSESVKTNAGFGILSRTRQFGAWLTKATGGEKMEVTRKDLNALAPNSF